MRMLKRIATTLLVAGGLLAAVLVARAVRMPSRQIAVAAHASVFTPASGAPGAIDRLAAAIRFPTVTPDNPSDRQDDAFAGLEAYLVSAFPQTHATLERETVGHDALLYTWRGTDPSLKPV